MKILVFAGALRKDSWNKKFALNAEKLLRGIQGIEAEYIDLKPLEIPLYDGDIETQGIPRGVQTLSDKVRNAQALVISSPEYNASMSCVLKNTVDWLSRVKPTPLAGKPVLLLGASPGALGAVRGLWHARNPFVELKAHVFPDMMGLPKADQAFSPDGTLADAKTAEKLKTLLEKYLVFARSLQA